MNTASVELLKVQAELLQSVHLRDLLADQDRCQSMIVENENMILDFSRQIATQDTIQLLLRLAQESKLSEKIQAMAAGQHINSTEDRAVMHIALRAPRDYPLFVDGINVVEEVHQVLDHIRNFSEKVRNGEWLGATGKPLTSVVSIGIGGSYLGPEFVYEALRTDPDGSRTCANRTLRFLANVDPIDVARQLNGLNPETTLVVVVSKTFTTAETMLNARTLRQWLINSISSANPVDVIRQHMIAVSAAPEKAVEFGIDGSNVFGFWDWVGGRYSVCSAVGVVPLSLHFGFNVIEQFLAGAHNMDKHFLSTPLEKNIPVLIGLLGVWNSSFLNFPTRAILPYCQALIRFAAHIQQVEMESNGKQVRLDGSECTYPTGEVIFGEPGTNGQHSFYQLLHQGRIVPAEFIGFAQSQNPLFIDGEQVSNHDELMSNFFAQPDALALGKTVQDLEKEGVPEHLRSHKKFSGNRPSLSILFTKLDAYSCGQLLSIYEHRTAVQGMIWGINSFDQWGVELGKVLAKQVRNQLQQSRNGNQQINGFNSSTSFLLQKYLQFSS